MAAPIISNTDTTNTTTPSGPSSQTFRILVIAGDHVGPEVMAEALKVLDVVQELSPAGVTFQYNHQIAGGASIDKHQTPITDEVLRIAKDESDAVLFGSVGGPEW